MGAGGTSIFSECARFSAHLASPSLSAPANGASGQGTLPTFSWTNVSGNVGYRLMVATSQAALPRNPALGSCASCVINAAVGTSVTSFTPTTALAAGTTYYWQVHALTPGTVSYFADWSTIRNFTKR